MAELTEVQLGSGRKRKNILKTCARPTDYQKCIFCQKEKSQSLYNFTTRGYDSLLFAVQNRDDDTAHRLNPEVTSKN